ncbi:carbohydrate-binding protein [Metabacillus sp. GX 13764]|uniref:GH36-type glycosyl hydrolase domain-containing protein n=1 Tax=Metabacillus kandeliae TaxID=2900151 RepID=UPI001E2A6597|nr:glucoamylase family protein [Metabacillus kandeliae]MCD7034018.1 carbohydrate-binding protein [Metabacillus kandeliae]
MIANSEQLRERAQEFALTHELNPEKRPSSGFWSDFNQDMKNLHSFAVKLSSSRADCHQPAESWLLDHINFMETQAQAAVRKLPQKSIAKLPAVRGGLPRIYGLCRDYLQASDGAYDTHSFEHYVKAYQEVSVLKVNECWALPVVMGIAITRILAEKMKTVEHHYEVCSRISFLLRQIKSLNEEEVKALLEKEAAKKPFGPVETVHLVLHLREREPDIRVVHDWLSSHVDNGEESLEQMISMEHQLQAELQVTSGNLVKSLHDLERMPWRHTFIRICHVEQILLGDEKGDYKKLDDESRDRLRDHAAVIAGRLGLPETVTARTAVRLAQEARALEEFSRKGCAAYYLIEPDGIKLLRDELAKTARPRRLPRNAVKRRPMTAYLAGTAVLFAVLLILASLWVGRGETLGPLSWAAVLVFLALPVSEWVKTFMHEAIVRSSRTSGLLRYDFSKQVSEDAAVMVVMPIIWSGIEEVDDVCDRLLVHYMANRQKNIYFGILADFTDAKEGSVPNDERILAHAAKRIQALSDKYGKDKFFLFHRSRLLNKRDGVYMGWERKRGKLVEFAELLGGSEKTSFTAITGSLEILPKIKYVFTADHDTLLPIGSVARLAGTMHFPFNRPKLNKEGTRVTEGYGVLQPRIGVSYDSVKSSRFAELWAGEPGIDPYAFAVSDAYQDLFGKGIFAGKGIFDVEAFRKTLADRIPDHHVLSHDLLEGGFLRAGLVSDVEVVESHPASYYSYQKRAHRWIRGDWQLLKWLGRACPDRKGYSRKIDLCGQTRLQIMDNLRRSLLAPGLFAAAFFGLFWLPGHALVWETIVLLTVFLPFFRNLFSSMFDKGGTKGVAASFWQSALQLSVLPFSAVLSLDAAGRTLYRLYYSKRNLLEWMTAAQTDRKAKKGPVFLFEPAAYAVIVLFIGIAFLADGAAGILAGTAAVLLWLIAARPLIIMLNKPQKADSLKWATERSGELNQLAGEIWSFYEDYVTEKDSWLPPDNVQYAENEKIAHRTSPTNIGLYLASTAAARDLGFIDGEMMLDRLERTISTAEKLEKWHGHLLNWYDTESGEPLLPKYVSTVDSGNYVSYLMAVRQGLEQEEEHSERALLLADRISRLIEQTDFQALYNPDERLFCLGYHLEANQKDSILYDLLASEARQASFAGIALGQIPVSHWFTLGRTMTVAAGRKTLLSWSGTMFEYFMPRLIMRTYEDTIWSSTYKGAISRQIQFALKNKLPFGVSESGFYAFDYQMNYQYQAFGVPGLGLERGLEKNLVSAPYAAILALPETGEKGWDALRDYEKYGGKGQYGYYEAVDFTPVRLPKNASHQTVESYMAHHQGMSLLTIANLLLDDLFVKRFHADPGVKAAELLLQERIPEKAALIEEPIGLAANPPDFGAELEQEQRSFTERPSQPEVNVLSNGRLSSISTADGSGMLKWQDTMLTRWREDPVSDASGPVLYLYDRSTEEAYSTGRFPCGEPEEAKTVFRFDRTAFEGKQNGISFKLETAVSPEEDAEVRRLKLVNHTSGERTLEITTFFELSLAKQAEDTSHPAFSKLFVDTSHAEQEHCLLAKRRPREEGEEEKWAVHTVFTDGAASAEYEFETDRAKFISRGYSLKEPKAISSRLEGTTGSVTDPAFIMRRSLHLAPGETAHVYAVTGAAGSREEALGMLKKLKEPKQADRVFNMAWLRSRMDLRQRNLSFQEAAEAHILAGRLLYRPPLKREQRLAVQQNTVGQKSLWPYGVSGDVPFALVTIRSLADLPFVLLLSRQHQYISMLGVEADLVVLDQTAGGYQDLLKNRLRDDLASQGIGEMKRIVVLKAAQMKEEERTLLTAASHVLLHAGGPALSTQLSAGGFQPARSERKQALPQGTAEQKTAKFSFNGEFFNGWGGFAENGKAYEIHVQNGAYLPRPWSNVMANPEFGTLFTELGTGYTWWNNSREFKLTPWGNDPVLDKPGECLYLTDDAGKTWSAAPKPAGSGLRYKVTHGFGSSTVEQLDGDLVHTMKTTVPQDDPLKLIKLTLQNTSGEKRDIAVTYYAEWVLGVLREQQASFIKTEWDHAYQTLLARNSYQDTFRDGIAFLHMVLPEQGGSVSYTGDRAEFLGAGGTIEHPAALENGMLTNRSGIFANSCGALQARITLEPNSETEVTVLFGCTDSLDRIHELVRKYSREQAYEKASAETASYWNHLLGSVQVKTPDRKMDILLNGWLLYQSLVSRMWARTAFYQAGGAFGFRDQLQDALAFLHAKPSITRKQILIHAAHQYAEGDVQHWWHEETDKGIRTKFSDDLLWLPYTVSRYVEQTADLSILEETVSFLTSPVLKEEELERYEDTVVSSEAGTVLEHCLRAIRHSLKFGEHGIPLMGIGDWNDGMSRVGAKGRGESVWLGWFLVDILKRFEKMENLLEKEEAEKFRKAAARLQENLNANAWDGAWFRRAFTDAGTWLGTIKNKECRIDAIAQSWAVLSKGTTEERMMRVMRSFDTELVDREWSLAKLLTKAFNETKPSPGYIQGYPPGIRENGGQYTHGVIWGIAAWAELGRRDKAFELFSMLNPISHTDTKREVQIYGNEPYVMSADVYTASPHKGRAGWSWYTGAASWMYQAGLEYVLGVKRRGDELHIAPCVPEDWESFQIEYQYGAARYHIEVQCSGSLGDSPEWLVDGVNKGRSPYLKLEDDGKIHEVRVSAPMEQDKAI